MRLRTWDTRQPLDPGFQRDWQVVLRRSPHANFSLEERCLAWEARHGRHALAVRVEEGDRAAALALRLEGRDLVSGWPWRWQAVIADPASRSACGPSADECDWIMGAARAIAGGRRVRVHLPHAGRVPGDGYPAGGTILRSLDEDDDGFLKRMDVNKRRAVKRALREGWVVRDPAGPEEIVAFARIQRDVALGRWERVPEVPAENPEPGEGWREWELPWMWLLVAVRDGAVGAGSGYGFVPGGTVEYRANASTTGAKRDGANVLLAWEAMKRGRDRGCRWMNWGGSNEFKRELGGERVDVACRLGGGVVWWLPNAAAVAWRRARLRVPAVARALGIGRKGGDS